MKFLRTRSNGTKLGQSSSARSVVLQRCTGPWRTGLRSNSKNYK